MHARPFRMLLAAGALAAVLGLAAHAPAAGAGTQRYANAVTPLLDASGKTIGSVQPGAAVSVTGSSGSSSQVTIAGFAAANAPGTVYAYADRHIATVTGFTGNATKGATQNGYVAVTITGAVASSALVPDVATVWKAASDLYSQKCSQCHSLRPATDYTANQWPGIMKTQADNAGLDPGETALILTYLQTQSGK